MPERTAQQGRAKAAELMEAARRTRYFDWRRLYRKALLFWGSGDFTETSRMLNELFN
jgi:hypothetical protein